MTDQFYYKAFTADLRDPLQGGPPVWNGCSPFVLPNAKVDTRQDEIVVEQNLRHAYEYGLGIALPATTTTTLGWALAGTYYRKV